MTAQIANGGFEINLENTFDKTKNNLKDYLNLKMIILMNHYLQTY